ncbi:MAG TPA: histidine kinase [Gemmatimonadales bacterium]
MGHSANPQVPEIGGRVGGWRSATTIVMVWTIIGILESLKTWLFLGFGGVARSVPELLLLNMPWWYLWAALTPLTILAARRFPLARGTWPRALVAHLMIGTLISAAHLAAAASLMRVVGFRGTFATLGDQIRWLTNTYLIVDLVTYACILAAATAIALRDRLRDEEIRAAQLATRTAQLEAGLSEARLHALERELDPHFLFNTLHTVSGLARQGETRLLRTVLARLADLLRRTMDRSRGHEVPLSDELELLDEYLEIERIRLADRLTVEIVIDPTVIEALVPTFMLQPLAENAVRHGIAPAPDGGTLRIHAAPVNGSLHLSVQNSQHAPGNDIAAWREGVGLGNTRARLVQLYGPDATLDVTRSGPGDVQVTVTMPLRRHNAQPEPDVPGLDQ